MKGLVLNKKSSEKSGMSWLILIAAILMSTACAKKDGPKGASLPYGQPGAGPGCPTCAPGQVIPGSSLTTGLGFVDVPGAMQASTSFDFMSSNGQVVNGGVGFSGTVEARPGTSFINVTRFDSFCNIPPGIYTATRTLQAGQMLGQTFKTVTNLTVEYSTGAVTIQVLYPEIRLYPETPQLNGPLGGTYPNSLTGTFYVMSVTNPNNPYQTTCVNAQGPGGYGYDFFYFCPFVNGSPNC